MTVGSDRLLVHVAVGDSAVSMLPELSIPTHNPTDGHDTFVNGEPTVWRAQP